MRYCEAGEVFGAERDEFGGPAAEDYALIPGFVRRGWD